MPRRSFADKTKVPVDRSRAEIERLITQHGATDFGFMQTQQGAQVLFKAKGRRVMFVIRYPAAPDRAYRGVSASDRQAQEIRRRWRALGLVIKAKLESVASGVEVFDDAFLAQIVLPDGTTVGKRVRPSIQRAYETGGEFKALPEWTGSSQDEEPVDG